MISFAYVELTKHGSEYNLKKKNKDAPWESHQSSVSKTHCWISDLNSSGSSLCDRKPS